LLRLPNAILETQRIDNARYNHLSQKLVDLPKHRIGEVTVLFSVGYVIYMITQPPSLYLQSKSGNLRTPR